MAHRGNSRSFPENTFAAFDAAILAGVDAIELDLQLSRDGVPVVFHDKTLRRHHGKRHKIHHQTLAELRELDFGRWFNTATDRQVIPTLDEVLVRYGPHTTLMLELKTDTDRGPDARARGETLAREVVAAVRRRRLRQRVWILAFDGPALRCVRKEDEGLRCALGFGERVQPDRSTMQRVRPFQAILLPGRNLTAALAERMHQAGKKVLAYRCDTAPVARKAVQRGADALMADDPVWLETFLDSMLRGRGHG